MKTIQRSGEIRRVSDATAEKLIANGWKYVPKSAWKEIRGNKITSDVIIVNPNETKVDDTKKRKNLKLTDGTIVPTKSTDDNQQKAAKKKKHSTIEGKK